MARRQVEMSDRRRMWRLGTRYASARLAILTPLAGMSNNELDDDDTKRHPEKTMGQRSERYWTRV